MPYYFDEFATEDIQMWVRECGKDIPKAKLRGDLTELENLYNDINTLSNDIELFYQNQYLLYGDDSQTRRRNNFMYQEYGWSGAEKKCINLDTNEVFTDQEAYDVCITNL